MKSKFTAVLLSAALAIAPLKSVTAQPAVQSEHSKQIAIRIAQLPPGVIKRIPTPQPNPVIPVRGGGLVAGLIIGAVVATAISRSIRKKRYKRYRRSGRKYRRYW